MATEKAKKKHPPSFCAEQGTPEGDAIQDYNNALWSLLKDEFIKNIPSLLRRLLIPLVVWLVSVAIFWKSPHRVDIAFSITVLAIMLLLLYDEDKKTAIVFIISIGAVTLVFGVLHEIGHLEWAVYPFTPVIFYVAMWTTMPWITALCTAMVLGIGYVWRLERKRRALLPIRVQLADGSTGTIDPQDFDPATMRKL